jgi:RNA polymerase sigma-70 factor (sigma-E family)
VPVRESPRDVELEQFVAVRGVHLRRTAALLAGGRDAGEDLFQAALERLLARRQPVEGDREGYLRRTMANLVIDDFRRRASWQRKLPLLRAEAEELADPMSEVDLRDAILRAMLQLPPRQRAVLVLRYWEQMSEAEAAAELGWPEGTVKSTTARALRRLRELSGAWTKAREGAL